MESSEQSQISAHVDQRDSSVEVVNIDLGNVQEVEKTREPLTDLGKHVTRHAVIERVELVRINSPYAKSADKKVHKLRVIGAVVETVTTDDGKTIEFRPSELLDVEENADGSFKGLPEYEKSKWQRFKKTLRINNPTEAMGKSLPMKINTNKSGQDFLGFMY